MSRLGATVIDKDDDPMIGTLLEADIPGFGISRFLQVLCGTGRTFSLCVPVDMTSALEANAWTYELSPEELKWEFRT